MKKFLLIILSLSLLIPLLAACGEDATQESSGDFSVVEDELVDVVDMQGREFHILCHDFGAGSNSILGYTGEVIYNEEKPDAVDEAKKRVIDNIEAAYNCKISGDLMTSGVADEIRTQINAGLPFYDIVFDSPARCAILAIDQLLIDLKSIPTIDLSKSWFDQNAVKDLSIGEHVYFACGDINTYDDQGTWCIIFNKDLKDRLGIEENFYDLVKNDEWTFEKFVEICRRDITSDINGDSTIDEKDRWAFGTETYNIYVHFVSAGMKIADKDENDLPMLSIDNNKEATFKILSDVLDFYNDSTTTMVANYKPYTDKGFTNVWEETVHKAFIEGRELFYMCGLINVASFRKMKDTFGILPVPKFYETQERYYHTVSCDNATLFYMPLGVVEPDDVGLIISALSKESKKYVTPAYYDKQLKYRDAKDEESAEMLDLIFASRTFDIGNMCNWSNVRGLYMDMDQGTIASRFDANIESVKTKMEEMIEDLG